MMLHSYKATIEYDGCEFIGWQRQKYGRSVQGELESVLRQVLQERVGIVGAGRTDAGVHATGQVAHFRTRSGMPPDRLLRALNSLLPPDISVKRLVQVRVSFHARRDARKRTYRYRISTVASALERNRCWIVKSPLDVSALHACAGLVKGSHDFRSFSRAASLRPHYRCIVTDCRWLKKPGLLEFSITADRFLHGMVRTLVGTMVEVARGRWSVKDFADILAAKDRKRAGRTAPPQGLFLRSVQY